MKVAAKSAKYELRIKFLALRNKQYQRYDDSDVLQMKKTETAPFKGFTPIVIVYVAEMYACLLRLYGVEGPLNPVMETLCPYGSSQPFAPLRSYNPVNLSSCPAPLNNKGLQLTLLRNRGIRPSHRNFAKELAVNWFGESDGLVFSTFHCCVDKHEMFCKKPLC
ncbi:hypothetical protein IW261DRAFT_1066083 [Armillaria novae-zelandiae]|uniref:Uncharacterized protein n=1 Tax=Armillaria novae-zelandiae TaxID=153914 RepID=A0AA39PBQ9_9AGAR|nr:hypothetical protein IW261DRAFT_1066083 [Armillaria novae-zelandiae]